MIRIGRAFELAGFCNALGIDLDSKPPMLLPSDIMITRLVNHFDSSGSVTILNLSSQ